MCPARGAEAADGGRCPAGTGSKNRESGNWVPCIHHPVRHHRRNHRDCRGIFVSHPIGGPAPPVPSWVTPGGPTATDWIAMERDLAGSSVDPKAPPVDPSMAGMTPTWCFQLQTDATTAVTDIQSYNSGNSPSDLPGQDKYGIRFANLPDSALQTITNDVAAANDPASCTTLARDVLRCFQLAAQWSPPPGYCRQCGNRPILREGGFSAGGGLLGAVCQAVRQHTYPAAERCRRVPHRATPLPHASAVDRATSYVSGAVACGAAEDCAAALRHGRSFRSSRPNTRESRPRRCAAPGRARPGAAAVVAHAGDHHDLSRAYARRAVPPP